MSDNPQHEYSPHNQQEPPIPAHPPPQLTASLAHLSLSSPPLAAPPPPPPPTAPPTTTADAPHCDHDAHHRAFAAPAEQAPTADTASPPQPSPPPELQQQPLCTICYDAPGSDADVAVVPPCGHSFCLACLVSWTAVRPVCPNCKAPFRAIRTRRDPATGAPLPPGAPPLDVDVSVLRCADWLHLREVHSAQHDIEASFTLPPLDDTLFFDDEQHAADLEAARQARAAAQPQAQQQQQQQQQQLLRQGARSINSPANSSVQQQRAATGAHQAHGRRRTAIADEDLEDELEMRFWEQEQEVHDRLMRSSRVVSNRRFGPTGYIAAGRMRATPRPRPANNANNTSGTNRHGAAGSAAQHAASASAAQPTSRRAAAAEARKQQKLALAGAKADEDLPNAAKMNAAANAGGRKKKVKKKSRAGIAKEAAAKAAREAAEREAAAAAATEAAAAAAAANAALTGSGSSNANGSASASATASASASGSASGVGVSAAA